MFRAMALKELREIWFIAIGAVVLSGLLLFAIMVPKVSYFFFALGAHVPFVEDPFIGIFCGLAAAMAFLLGLWQTFGESLRGTYPFLLHRPAGRTWLMGVKLLVGLVTLMVVSAVPLLIYGLWAATPGTHASPFEWGMTVPTWGIWFVMPVLYLGTFLTGIIPGQWYGARLLPLAASVFILFMLTVIIFNSEITFWMCVASVVVDIWMMVLIFFVAKARNYA